MNNIEQIMNDRITPRWARDIYRLLPIKSQFILSGNTRDIFLMANEKGTYSTISFFELLWMTLQSRGFKRLEVFDPIDGIRIFPSDGKTAPTRMTSEELANTIASKLEANERVAIVIDFASRIDHESRLFHVCDKLASCLNPKMIKENNDTYAFYNPIIWLFDKDGDVPSWYGAGNHKIHRQEIPRPDIDQRNQVASMKLKLFEGIEKADEETKKAYADIFAKMSDGFTLSEMTDVARLSKIVKGVGLEDIDDAVRSYKTGDPALDNPWKSPGLRDRIKTAEDNINNEVLGQRTAVRHALDILKRSIMGLTGAQASISNNRPRGVLFLAGPTGVGKTELAKSLTKSLFGDEKAYIRFDMSEFSQEHSDARLLGAPPGYVGYEGGGELVNAIRLKPFSLLLFDEIEKANGKILDKFLQILDDGRLTSGKGETVYFSECVIVFTSNLGIIEEVRNELGVVVETRHRVQWTDDFELVNKEVRTGIESHFTKALKRPELLNRLGNNIVVFDFIRPDVADKIIDIMLNKIAGRVREEQRATLVIDAAPINLLREECKRDLSYGGRGIGNRLETMLINPLSRKLFELQELAGKTVTVSQIQRLAKKGADSETYELDIKVS